ncbi:MAG TPA: GNAT family protein [Novosphingobium sp.]|nr:GNAT family protein [Novosphingobium sp.]
MIETERLILRPYVIDDFECYLAMLAQPTPHFPSRQMLSREDAWMRILGAVGHWALFGYGLFAVIGKDSNRYLGEAGLMDLRRPIDERFRGCDEAGWYIVAEEQGKGLGSEASRAAQDWYQANRGQFRTICIIDTANGPSRALANKLGYEPAASQGTVQGDLIVFERGSALAPPPPAEHIGGLYVDGAVSSAG